MSKTSSNNNNKVSSPINKANSNKKSTGEELNSNRQKQDLVQVTKNFSHILHFLLCLALFLINCIGEVSLWEDDDGREVKTGESDG